MVYGGSQMLASCIMHGLVWAQAGTCPVARRVREPVESQNRRAWVHPFTPSHEKLASDEKIRQPQELCKSLPFFILCSSVFRTGEER